LKPSTCARRSAEAEVFLTINGAGIQGELLKRVKGMSVTAPTLETERLVLRAFKAGDFPDFCVMWNEPAVYQYITGQPFPDEDQWTRLLKMVGHWQFVGYGAWALIDKTTGELVGQVGFNDFRRALTVPMPEPDMGWTLRKHAQGKGFALEACTAAITWFENEIGGDQIACIIDPANAPSLKLAAKLKFKLAAETSHKSKPTLLFRRQLRR
jgi:RimJ/RimL family protein N-acetyltransferase